MIRNFINVYYLEIKGLSGSLIAILAPSMESLTIVGQFLAVWFGLALAAVSLAEKIIKLTEKFKSNGKQK